MEWFFRLFPLLFAGFSCLVFRSTLWDKCPRARIGLFVLPCFIGFGVLYGVLDTLSVESFRRSHNLISFCSVFVSLSLLPSWYKLMWYGLKDILRIAHCDTDRLILVILLMMLMITAIIVFFALYYVWIDALAGFTQGLRTSMDHRPILMDFPTAFYFSFVTYFTLGYGDLIPYGPLFRLLVFFECAVSEWNTGILLIYAYNLLFERRK